MRAAAYASALMLPTKNPMGRFDRYEIAMAAQTVARTRPTDTPIAWRGRLVNARAAAGGPSKRLNHEPRRQSPRNLGYA